MYQVGSIILVENQIFELGFDGSKTQIDHSRKRAAIVICETQDSFYYLTLTSKPDNRAFCYETNETIIGNGTIKKEKQAKKQYIKIAHIYKKKIYGAIEVTKINDDDLLNLLLRVYKYHEKRNYNNFKEVEKEILKQIKKVTLRLENKNNKKIK